VFQKANMPVSFREMFIWDNQRSHIHSSRGRKSANEREASSKGRLGVAKFRSAGI
jgi:hypothetical protein